jgi:hypothetical protein
MELEKSPKFLEDVPSELNFHGEFGDFPAMFDGG